VPVEVANESEIAVDEGELAGVCRYVIAELGVNPMAELSVLCVDRDHMATLHERWMGEKGATDVLAFPMDELDTARPDDPDPGPALLGDVVLCPAVAVRQARASGHTMDDELVLLAVHGVLHLLGYDHEEPDEEKEMFGLQQKLLDGWRSAPREPVTGAAADPGAAEPGAGPR
jgi:probable rRNA maturation factor